MCPPLVAVVRSLRPELPIVAQTRRADHEEELRGAGASSVIAVEGAADRELARVVLEQVGAAPHEISMLIAGVEPDGPGCSLSEEQRMSERCRHGRDTRTVFPGSLAPPISLDSRLAATTGSRERGCFDVSQAWGVESDRRS